MLVYSTVFWPAEPRKSGHVCIIAPSENLHSKKHGSWQKEPEDAFRFGVEEISDTNVLPSHDLHLTTGQKETSWLSTFCRLINFGT